MVRRAWIWIVWWSPLLCMLGASSGARAQPFQYLDAAVLEPSPSVSFASLSIGAPSVTYDPIRDRFLMVFEARTPLADRACPQGIWALGLATSPDGVTWDLRSTALLRPTPRDGSFYSCVAGHPAAVFRARGDGELHVLFKAEQDLDTCVNDGCPYTGIGGLLVTFDASGEPTTVAPNPEPVLPLSGPGGHPSYVRDGNTFRLLYQRYPDVYRTSSVTLDAFPPGIKTFDAGLDSFASDKVPWQSSEFKSPSVLCEDSLAHPFAAFVGSVDTNFGGVVDGGWGKAISSNGTSWILAPTATEAWTNDDDWRHWDVLRLVTGDYLVWFSKKDERGVSAIYFGGTPSALSFNNSDVESRICD